MDAQSFRHPLTYFTFGFLILGLIFLPAIISYFEPLPIFFKIMIFQVISIDLMCLSIVRIHDFFGLLSKTSWALVALLCVIALLNSSIENGDYHLTIARTAMWFVNFVFGLCLVLAFRTLSHKQLLLFMLVSLGVGNIIYMGWVLEDLISTADIYKPNCVQVPGFGNVRLTNFAFSGVSALFFGASIQQSQPKWIRVCLFILATFCVFYTAYTGSRGAIVSLLAAITLCAIPLRRPVTSLFLYFVASLLISYLLMTALQDPSCGSFDIFARSAKMGMNSIETFSSGRTEIWKATLELIGQRPWFGHGEINLKAVVGLSVREAHNSILQSFLAWGIVGALCFWSLIGMASWKILRLTIARPLDHIPYALSIVCVLMYSMIDGTLYFSYSILMATVFTSACFAVKPPQVKLQHAS